jgi:hypothetical protein
MRKYSVLILNCIPGISILLYKNHHHLCKSNKHHASDCTIFVLVEELVAYYDHRHKGIYETNILQAVKQAKGKTGVLKAHPGVIEAQPTAKEVNAAVGHVNLTWNIKARSGVVTAHPGVTEL